LADFTLCLLYLFPARSDGQVQKRAVSHKWGTSQNETASNKYEPGGPHLAMPGSVLERMRGKMSEAKLMRLSAFSFGVLWILILGLHMMSRL
jgi:hypothetical protein